jgi:hypothetical protein
LFPTCLLGEAAWQRYTDSKTTKRQDLAHRLRGYMSRWGSSCSCSSGIDWQERPGRNAAVEDRLSVLYCDESLPPLFVFCAGMLLARQHRAMPTSPKTGRGGMRLRRRWNTFASVGTTMLCGNDWYRTGFASARKTSIGESCPGFYEIPRRSRTGT